jgi:RHS repeat-associated protein
MEAARKEASESGIVYMENQAGPERYMLTSVEMNALRNALNYANTNLGSRLSVGQNVWRETYSYDTRGNRTSKATGWGTIRYSYDKENRLTQKGSIAYTYDKDGNLLTETGVFKEASYTYNGQNRMASSMVYNKAANSRSTTGYTYDAYGRRTVSEDANPANRAMGSAQAVRTLYDAFTFDVVQEGQTTSRGGFNEYYAIPDADTTTETDPNAVSGLRYQYVGDGSYTSATERTRNTNTGPASPSRYTGTSVSLYAQGEAVAVSYTSSGTNRGGVSYLGKDILGSVKASYDSYGVLEERYEYDAFGTPYKGDLSGGMNYGYTGKPFDATTGMYNYGYRDYQPSIARFTTVDPVRDGNNWFSYVNNDPVNWVDPWGLWTFQVGVTASAGAGTGVSTSTGIVIAWNPSSPFSIEVGRYNTQSMGSTVGASVSASIDVTTSSNTSANGIAGKSMVNGVSVNSPTGAYVGFTANHITSLDGAKPATSASLAVGVGTSEVHSQITFTQTYTTEISMAPVVNGIKGAAKAVSGFVSGLFGGNKNGSSKGR